MYKTVRQGESCLQYRILPQEEGGGGAAKRRRAARGSRLACVLLAALVVGCLAVTAAVLLPILLTTNIVALPAGFRTLALRQRGSSAQYIAILPVREARFKILPAPQPAPDSTSSALLTAQWAGLTLWKSYGAWRVVVPVVCLTLILLGAALLLLRRHYSPNATRPHSRGIGGESGTKSILLAEASEED